MMKNIAFQLLCVLIIRVECFPPNGAPSFAYIGFTNAFLSVPEGAGQIKVCMIKEGITYLKRDVQLRTIENTAKAGQDYIPVYNKTISFPADMSPNTTTCFLQNITDNNITEYNKTFYINMTTSNPSVVLVKNLHNLTITIVNDDKVTVQFEKEAMVVEEDADEGKVDLVCAITEGVALMPIYLDFEANSDEALVTAESGSDFILRKNKAFFFPPGEKRLNVTVDIKRDGDVESAEVFSLRIKGLDERFAVAGERSITFVKIMDSSDVAKGVALKQKQDEEDEREDNVLLSLPIVVVAASFIIALLGITFLYYLFRKKVKATNQKE